MVAGFEPPHIRRIISLFSSKARSLNHSAILLPQNAISASHSNDAMCLQYHPLSLWTFLAEGFEPPHIQRTFSPFSSKARSLNHSAILLPLNVVYASHSNDGTCFSSPTAQPMDFFGSGIRTRHIRRIFSPFSSKARSLNHSAILLPKTKCGLCQP